MAHRLPSTWTSLKSFNSIAVSTFARQKIIESEKTAFFVAASMSLYAAEKMRVKIAWKQKYKNWNSIKLCHFLASRTRNAFSAANFCLTTNKLFAVFRLLIRSLTQRAGSVQNVSRSSSSKKFSRAIRSRSGQSKKARRISEIFEEKLEKRVRPRVKCGESGEKRKS